MSHELFYTSAPKGLNPGSRGFCTVACTRGMPAPLIEKVESLSGYRPLFPPHDAKAPLNPIVWSHLRLTVGGKTCSVLSRICAAGIDYTDRTNKFAHHVILENGELPTAGPAWLVSQPGFLETRWDGEVKMLPAGRLPPRGDAAPAVCRAWQKLTGDAGWAGVVAEAFMKDANRPVILLFEPGMDLLPLLAEAVQLLPPERRWGVTFSTYLSGLPTGISCACRGLPRDSEEAATARRLPGALVLDLGAPLGKANPGPLVDTARTGKASVPVGTPPLPSYVVKEMVSEADVPSPREEGLLRPKSPPPPAPRREPPPLTLPMPHPADTVGMPVTASSWKGFSVGAASGVLLACAAVAAVGHFAPEALGLSSAEGKASTEDVRRAALEKYTSENGEELKQAAIQDYKQLHLGDVRSAAAQQYLDKHAEDIKQAAAQRYEDQHKDEVKKASVQAYLKKHEKDYLDKHGEDVMAAAAKDHLATKPAEVREAAVRAYTADPKNEKTILGAAVIEYGKGHSEEIKKAAAQQYLAGDGKDYLKKNEKDVREAAAKEYERQHGPAVKAEAVSSYMSKNEPEIKLAAVERYRKEHADDIKKLALTGQEFEEGEWKLPRIEQNCRLPSDLKEKPLKQLEGIDLARCFSGKLENSWTFRVIGTPPPFDDGRGFELKHAPTPEKDGVLLQLVEKGDAVKAPFAQFEVKGGKLYFHWKDSKQAEKSCLKAKQWLVGSLLEIQNGTQNRHIALQTPTELRRDDKLNPQDQLGEWARSIRAEWGLTMPNRSAPLLIDGLIVEFPGGASAKGRIVSPALSIYAKIEGKRVKVGQFKKAP